MNFKPYDCVIFGASGFVGKFTVLEAIEILKDLKWAIAGRSPQKLKLVLEEISYKTEKDLSSIPILVANGNDVENLKELIEQCKVLINCCGPYQLLAENILTTCILNGTHYVDMCEDPYFNELMELKYHEKAEKNNVYIVSSCGFHTFPIDVGLNFLRQNFKGTINHVDAYVRYNFLNDFYLPICPLWSASSWFSLISLYSKTADLPFIRYELREKPEPNLLPKQPIEELSQRSKYKEKGIMVHFPFIDQQAVERSQYLYYVQDNLRPIQFYKYIEFPSLISAFFYIVWCLIISVLSQFVKTRNFVIKYPKLFSFGTFSSNSPNPYVVQMTSYKITLNASGWSKPISRSNAASANDVLDNFMNVEINGKNPFYGCGCLFLLLSARTILEETETLPGTGGVYPPGFAFQKTNILEKLEIYKNYLRLRIL